MKFTSRQKMVGVLTDEVNTSGVIKPNEDTVAKFTNEYRPNEYTAKFQAKKLLDWKATNVKGFKFELVDAAGVVVDKAESLRRWYCKLQDFTFYCRRYV